MRATRIPLALFAALLALTSCDGTMPQEPQEPELSATLLLEAVTPMSATGIVGEELEVAPVVRVTREDGLPVGGIQVSFTLSAGGSVGNATAVTDGAGRATPGTWRLGPGAELQTLTAQAAGRSLVFTADAQPGPIAALTVVDGNNQRAAGSMPLPEPLRVKATDGYGNVVTGGTVTFEVLDGGGLLEPAAAISGPDGIAESRWTLGPSAGRQHAQAGTGEAATAQFAAEAYCQAGQCSFELAYSLNGNILIFDGATGGIRQLTNDGLSHDPAWSPDGKRIAFARYILGDEPRWSVYVMNSDGSGVTRVTGPGFRSPTWSPQGNALAFSSWSSASCPGDRYCGAIYVQELSEGSVIRQVAASGFEPAWSADGSRIAFVGHNGLINDEDYYSLRLVSPDGSGLTEITPSTWFYTTSPTWSPDGTRIAFSMGGHIYVVRDDGTGLTQLTTHWGALTLAWSPDGTRVAYGTRDNVITIMEILAGGAGPTIMISGGSPSWRP